MSLSRLTAGIAIIVLAGAAVWYALLRPTAGNLPAPESEAYEEVVRAFYRGLAALESGLVDDAKANFTRATSLVPAEPAGWANLAVAHLRLAEFEPAASAAREAAARAPTSGAIAMLQGALEGARGDLDAAIDHLQRSVDLEPDSARAKFALADMIQRAGGPDADTRSATLIDEVLALEPDNLAVLVERVRLAVRLGRVEELRQLVDRVATDAATWPPEAVEQLDALNDAAAAGDLPGAARATAFLRNVLARVPAFRDGLAAISVPAELVAESFDGFLTLPVPGATPAPIDAGLTHSRESLGTVSRATALTLAFSIDGDTETAVLVADSEGLRRAGAAAVEAEFPAGANQVPPSPDGVLALDWNGDFRGDVLLAGRGGVRLLLSGEDGTLADATPVDDAVTEGDYFGAWAADLDMDGDVDVVLADQDGDPGVLRNNADGTWQLQRPFDDVPGARGFTWADFDGDGDPDPALLDAEGSLHLFVNQQAGQFERRDGPDDQRDGLALAAGDANGDGILDLLTLTRTGAVNLAWLAGNGWQTEQLVEWPGVPGPAAAGSHRLLLADLDNNGALDLVASGAGRAQVWLTDEAYQRQALPAIDDADVFAVADLTADGRLDLAALADGQPVQLVAQGVLDYHWQTIWPRAQTAAGDQRINSFGVGGEIEVRSGRLAQKQLLTGGPLHFGLGTRTDIDVTRIVWPNGVMQAEFDLPGDQVITAEQRLKGSCPWLFTFDGAAMQFVTDFLWRSPLGLRLNAQDTADAGQTEDWVKIRGDQLQPRDGVYDVRITAELWESHFFDHVSLMVVDHPADVEVFVDERFARQAPDLAVHGVGSLHPLAGVWDDSGQDVAELVRERDGRHLAGFDRGRYQGLTRDHTLEFELDDVDTADRPTWLVAHGWVYPTDSSINVAIAQGNQAAPYGLVLEAQDDNGEWQVVHPDLGFPAGKTKTILIDLTTAPPSATRLRLRTNMEIYWDQLAVAGPPPSDDLRTTNAEMTQAELRYRGFSRTTENVDAHAPEVPHYSEIANTTPRWRDLVGYHTRFGDVADLLSRVDDRYVIMNAGDELRLAFAEQPPPPEGWTRDFVLVGDGWEKDGDYNTAFSKTVLPLPTHARPEYTSRSGSPHLEDDPVYLQHPDDWQRYHTRFVAPDRYLRGLRAH